MRVLRLLRPRAYIRQSTVESISYQSSLSLGTRNMQIHTSSWTPHGYPPTPRTNHIDLYKSEANGEVKVPDPYVWLEKDGEEREKWLVAQEALARDFLDAFPDRSRLEEEIRASTDYEKVSPLGSADIWRDGPMAVQCSSVLLHCVTMADGIGLTIVACRHSQV
jgi:Prolyl oligopeptidase, N-terminal beta-propeller domain